VLSVHLLCGLALAAAAPFALAADTPPDAPPDTPPATPSAPIIEYTDGKLTLDVTKVPVALLLEQISNETGAEIRGSAAEEREVSAHFEDVPLEQALARVLGNENFILIYGRDGEPVELSLLGGPTEVPPPGMGAVNATDTAPSRAGLTASAALYSMIARHPPVEVSGTLAAKMGRTTVRLPQLLRTVSRENDQGVRGEAMRAFIHAVEADQGILQAMSDLDDEGFTTFIRRRAGRRGTELALYMAAQATNPKVRSKAATAARQLATEVPAGPEG
jgi:hypothetical protein